MRRGNEREGVGMGGAMGNGAELRNEKRKGEERCGEACVGDGLGMGGWLRGTQRDSSFYKINDPAI